MVKFFTNKDGKLDMLKAIGVLTIFMGLLTIAFTYAMEARQDAKSACIKVDNLEKTVDKIDRNVEKLLDLHLHK